MVSLHLKAILFLTLGSDIVCHLTLELYAAVDVGYIDIFIPVSKIKTTRKLLHFSLFANIGAVQETGNSGSAHLFESVCYAI